MPSPFPGMDPFLEHPRWFGGLHHNFITFAAAAIQDALPDDYSANTNERVWIEGPALQREPDFDVVRRTPARDVAGFGGPTFGGGAAVADPAAAGTLVAPGAFPVVLTAVGSPVRQRYVELLYRDDFGERVIAVFELLSPTNKRPGTGRDLYLRKQREVRTADCHLIEVDLLRGGTPTTALPDEFLADDPPPYDYHAVVTRPIPDHTRYEIYPVRLRDRLPTISVPLLSADGAVPLDLQAVFERAYDAGPYRKRVNYADPAAVTPALEGDDAAWAAELLANAKGS